MSEDLAGIFTFNLGHHMHMVIPLGIILIGVFNIAMHLGFCLVLGREPLQDTRVSSDMAIASNQHNRRI